MSKLRVCIFKYGHKTMIVPLAEFENFQSIQEYVQSKRDELVIGKYIITYSRGDHKTFLFNNEKDFVGLDVYLYEERLKSVNFVIEQQLIDKVSFENHKEPKHKFGRTLS